MYADTFSRPCGKARLTRYWVIFVGVQNVSNGKGVTHGSVKRQI